jgi:hypothetical protein
VIESILFLILSKGRIIVDSKGAAMEGAIRVWCGASGKTARQCVDTVCSRLPPDSYRLESCEQEAMAFGEVIVMVLSHVAVTGLIEGARTLWDRFQTPLEIELPGGDVVSCRGSHDVVQQIRRVVDAMRGATNATDVKERLDLIVSRLDQMRS